MTDAGRTVGVLEPERQDYYRRLRQAIERARGEERRAQDAMLDARVVIGALQAQLAKLWDETVAEHGLRPDGEYTIDDAGQIIEIVPAESAS
ncbi:hypothetical protein CMK11_12060 [Candidatus Poribacteria bacterium]|nr:hypothetical protein [Candidatus Poribacteria bacterium]